MRRNLRYAVAAALAGTMLGCLPAFAAPGADCKPSSLEHLKASSPDGFAIYRKISDQNFFKSWINCDDAQFDLSTAVHESTHFIVAETDAYPLVGGGSVARPHEVSAFFAPARIAATFATSDYAKIYLRRGKASSSTDFMYLLDELNAYSHDLNAAVDLKALSRSGESVDHRDGLAALMAFVAVYAETAKASEPATWNGLREPTIARTISAIWDRAERVMASSCGIPNFGIEDKSYIRKVCATEATAALEPILGRAPVCPTACLTPDVAQADGDQVNGEQLVDEQTSDEVMVAVSPFHSTSRRRAYRQQ